MTSRYSTGMILISLQFLLLPEVWGASFCDIVHCSRPCVDNVFKIILPVKPPDGGEVLFHPCLVSSLFLLCLQEISGLLRLYFTGPVCQLLSLWFAVSWWLKRSNSASQWFVCTMKFNSPNLSAYILYLVKKDCYIQTDITNSLVMTQSIEKIVKDKDINTWVLITRSKIYLNYFS